MMWIIGFFAGFVFFCGLLALIVIYYETRPRTIVYWDGSGDSDDFRDGLARWVPPDKNRPADEHFGEFTISRSLYQALFELGIIESFSKLPHDFFFGEYEEGALIGSGVAAAAEILRQKAGSLKQ